MGCGGSKRRAVGEYKEKDLFQEAHGSQYKEVRGLKVEDIGNLYKDVGKNNMFKEEINDHADESGPVQQWVNSLLIYFYNLVS